MKEGRESGSPISKDEAVYLLIKPLIVFEDPEGMSVDELFREGYRQAKILISPMTPPNYEIEKAVDRILEDAGYKRSRSRKSAEARVLRKKPNNLGRKSAANEELSPGPKKSRRRRRKSGGEKAQQPRTLAEEHDL